MFTDIGDLQQQLESLVAAIAEKTTSHTEEVGEPMVESDGASEATQFEAGADHGNPPGEQDTLGELLDIDHIVKQNFDAVMGELIKAFDDTSSETSLTSLTDAHCDFIIKHQARLQHLAFLVWKASTRRSRTKGGCASQPSPGTAPEPPTVNDIDLLLWKAWTEKASADKSDKSVKDLNSG